MITKEEIENIALLSKLQVTQDEILGLMKDMQEMVGFAHAVCDISVPKEQDIDGYVGAESLRDDRVRPSVSDADILSNAPEVSRGHFLLRKKV